VNPGTRATRQPGSYSTSGGRTPGRNGAAPPGSSQNQLYEVRVPQGVRGGQTFQVEISGHRVNVRCPSGIRPGQNLRISLPNPAGAAAQERQRQAYMVTIPTGVRPGERFRVMVNGQELMVTCPQNARPGTNVRIYPPDAANQGGQGQGGGGNTSSSGDSSSSSAASSQPQIQTFEVQVPAGVMPGQPFALIANGQRVLVTCPSTAGPGQRIRFQLPVGGGGGGRVGRERAWKSRA